jgi:hypothetical protein
MEMDEWSTVDGPQSTVDGQRMSGANIMTSSASIAPSGIPDPDFSPYHKMVFDF